MIYEVKTFVNEKGLEVRYFREDKAEGADQYYLGAAVLLLATGNPQQPHMPQRFEFEFPKEIASVTEAFEKFEPTMQAEFDRQKKAYEEKKREQQKQIIIPGGMDMKNLGQIKL